MSTPDPFEAFVWAVIGQQISLHVAFRLKAALVRRYGLSLEAGGRAYFAFPTPEEAPDYYVDYGETGPYVAETGESECAT